MSDILLIQPPIRDFYLTAKRTFPYGLACIAATLIRSGFSVDILDALATRRSRILDFPPELEYLKEFYGRPDGSPFALFSRFRHYGYSFESIGKMARESGAFLVGISSLFTPYEQEAIRTAEIVKAYHPDCKIVLGGHHPTALPQSVMESAAVDFVLRGEGEVSMPLLARALRQKLDYRTIPGLVYRQADGTLHIDPPAQMDDLDDYPLPAVQLTDQRFYRRNQRAAIVIAASRGCPLKCSYCSISARTHLTYRRRRIAAVIREIEQAADQGAVGLVDFEDENLSLDRAWFLQLLHEIEQRFGAKAMELRAMNGLFPPTLDEEVIHAMQTAGFKTLNLALGSTVSEQLNRFQRPDVRSAFDRALLLAEKFDLQAVGYVIIGAPFQTAADSIADLLYLAQRRVLAAVSVFYPSPGSPDYNLCEEHGILPPTFACIRSSALPLSHTTTRIETVTVLRLARLLNFMKSLIDNGIPLPEASAADIRINDPADRVATGRQLLQKFLYDGRMRGVTPEGSVFDHVVSEKLTRLFLEGLKSVSLRGSRSH
jgi:anaerobic magnesium-protoporphyrin IX monomethyl ester cyclase